MADADTVQRAVASKPLRVHVFLSIYDEVFLGVLGLLTEHHPRIEIGVTAWHPDVVDRIQASGLTVRHAYKLWESVEQTSSSAITPEEINRLRGLESVTAPHGVWEMAVADLRRSSGWSRERLLRFTLAVSEAVERAYDDVDPDFVLTAGVACLPSYLHYALARARRVPCLSLFASRTPGLVYLSHDEFAGIDGLDAELADVERTGLSDDERSQAESFVQAFRDRPAQPTSATIESYTSRPRLRSSDVAALVRVARSWLATPERESGSAVSPMDAISSRVRRIARDRRTRSLFEPPRHDEPYVVYPLHVEPEASVYVQAAYFRDQPTVIEQAAMALPVDHVLYVKEHRPNIGRRPNGYYDRILRVPNVRLIDPFTDPFELVRGCQAVVTLTSTMGWEAVLMGKPVVTLGHAFYNTAPGVSRAASPEDLPRALREAIGGPAPRREDLIRYVAAYLRTQHRGEFLPVEKLPTVLSDDNLRSIADMVYAGWLRNADFRSTSRGA